jgi:steroid delta-isomerase-like uncharacterized protein
MHRSLAAKIKAANAALIDDGNVGAVDEFFAHDYIGHGTKQQIAGPAAVRKFLNGLRRAFPDLLTEVEILVEGKDRVAWLRTLRGTHQGDYKGFPATGRPVVWRDMVVSRFRDGLIAEDWLITDLAEHLLRARKR